MKKKHKKAVLFLALLLAGIVALQAQSIQVSTLAGSDHQVINRPRGVAVSGEYLFVSDGEDHLIRKVHMTTKKVTILAGSTRGYADGKGSNARFNGANAITLAGNYLYVSDGDNQRIRKVHIVTGEVTTIAGSGKLGSDDGKGSQATFRGPGGLAVSGNYLYVADGTNTRIRKINLTTHQVSTLAGSTGGFKDGNRSEAKFRAPRDIAVSGDYLYVTDFTNHRIRKVHTSTGFVSTLAGSTPGYANGFGRNAKFNLPSNITVIGDYLYVSDWGNHRIRKIHKGTGFVSTVAGSLPTGHVDANGERAKFNIPMGVAISGRYLYVADHINNCIRSVHLATKDVDTFVGPFLRFANGPGSEAKFYNPHSIVVKGDYLYVADRRNACIRKIHRTTGMVTTLAGSCGKEGYRNGTGTQALFRVPSGLALSGNFIYVADSGNDRIRMVNINTGLVSTLAGSTRGMTDDVGENAQFAYPMDLTISGDYLYVTDIINHRIRRVHITSALVTTLAGGTKGFANGSRGNAKFNIPNGITASGNYLYIGDQNNHSIRKVNINNGYVTTLAGNGRFGKADGASGNARFGQPQGLAVSGDYVYVADYSNNRIRKVHKNDGHVSTLVGSSKGFADGIGYQAKFDGPIDVAFDGNVMYVPDFNNHRIRKIVSCPSVAPPTASATQANCPGNTVAHLKATVQSGETVKWYSSPSGGTPLPTATALRAINYYAETTNKEGCKSSTRTKVSVTLFPAVPALPNSFELSLELCGSTTIASLRLGTDRNGLKLLWYRQRTGGSPLPDATTFNVNPNTVVYYGEYQNTTTKCRSQKRFPLKIKVNPAVPSPSVGTSKSFCKGSKVASLPKPRPGPNQKLEWYLSEKGGSPLASSATLRTGNYYAAFKNTVTECESKKRSRLAVNITDPPTITATSLQSFCSNIATVAKLKATSNDRNATVSWYATPTGGTALASSTKLKVGSYYAEAKSRIGCKSIRKKVTVAFNPVAKAPTVTATTQTFCEGKKVSDLKATAKAGESLHWYTTATGGTALANTTTLKARNYYAGAKNNCGISTSRSIVRVIINPLPKAPTVTATTQAFCEGKKVSDLKVTAKAGESLHWYATATGGTALASTTTLKAGNYYAGAKNNCGVSASRTRVSVTINPLPKAPRIAASTQAFCEGKGKKVSDLKATVKAGERLHWYTTARGGTALASTATLKAGNYYAGAKNNCGVSTSRSIVRVIINPLPRAPRIAASTQAFCEGKGKKVSDLRATVKAGESLHWYTTARGGTALANTAILKVGNYYAGAKNNCGVSTSRTRVSVTINPLPKAPRVTATTQTFCEGKKVSDLKAIVKAGERLHWYTTARGGTALANTAILKAQNYFAGAKNNCGISTSRTRVSVTINPLPKVPRVTATTQTFCEGKKVSDLKAIVKAGERLHWYTTAKGGTALANTATLKAGNYYAGAKNNCGVSTSRTRVSVTINPLPKAPRIAASTQAFCEGKGKKVSDLKATVKAGERLHWYTTARGGTALANTATLKAGNYYAGAKNNCGVSTSRTRVTVTINPLPKAPRVTATTQVFCDRKGKKVSDLKATVKTGETLQWFAKASGGTALANTATLKAGNYFAGAKNNCGVSKRRTKVTVSFNPIAKAPTVTTKTQAFCEGKQVSDLKATVQAGESLQWYAKASGGTAIASTTKLKAGDYYAQANNNCGVSSSRTKVTVTINLLPKAPTVTAKTQVFCEGKKVSDLKATAQAGESLQWFAKASGGTVLVSTTALKAGDYYAEAKNNCGVSKTRAKVTVTIKSTTECTPTSIPKLDELGISFYPNPVAHRLTIDRGDHSDLQMHIIDNTGRRLLHISTDQQLTELDISNFAPGVYHIHLTTDSHHVIERLMKK